VGRDGGRKGEEGNGEGMKRERREAEKRRKGEREGGKGK
jgi:hypothetical protein